MIIASPHIKVENKHIYNCKLRVFDFGEHKKISTMSTDESTII